jgi:hypothetical protein
MIEKSTVSFICLFIYFGAAVFMGVLIFKNKKKEKPIK